MGTQDGGASAPPSSPSVLEEMLSALLGLIGRLLLAAARTVISLWAWSVPVLAVIVTHGYSSAWSWWQLTLASLAPVVWLAVMYRAGHLTGNFRAHRVRRQLRSAREHVASKTLLRHNVLTPRGRIVGFDIQAHPGWDHEQTLASVVDLLASYRLPPDAEMTTTPRSHGHVEVRLSQPIPLPQSYAADVADLTLSSQRGDGFVVGVGPRGLVIWEPPRTPHLLVMGRTGQGESVFAYSIVAQALLAGWQILGIDPKRLDLAWLSSCRLTPAVTVDQASSRLGDVCSHTMMRLDGCPTTSVSHVRDLPHPPRPFLVVIGEAAELLDAGSRPPKDSPGLPAWQARTECLEYVTSIARLGRAADVHLLLMAQRPDAAILGGQLRSQLAGRVIVGDAGGPEANRMAGLSGDVAERWESSERPPGRFVAMFGGDWVIGQAPYVSMTTLRSLEVSS